MREIHFCFVGWRLLLNIWANLRSINMILSNGPKEWNNLLPFQTPTVKCKNKRLLSTEIMFFSFLVTLSLYPLKQHKSLVRKSFSDTFTLLPFYTHCSSKKCLSLKKLKIKTKKIYILFTEWYCSSGLGVLADQTKDLTKQIAPYVKVCWFLYRYVKLKNHQFFVWMFLQTC